MVQSYSAWSPVVGAGDVGFLARNWHCSHFGLKLPHQQFLIYLLKKQKGPLHALYYLRKKQSVEPVMFQEVSGRDFMKHCWLACGIRASSWNNPLTIFLGFEAGLLDDPLWSRTAGMTKVMENVQKKCNFASLSGSDLRCCGSSNARIRQMELRSHAQTWWAAWSPPTWMWGGRTDQQWPSRMISQLWSVMGCPGFARWTWLLEQTNFKQCSRQLEYKIWSKQTSCYHWLWLWGA